MEKISFFDWLLGGGLVLFMVKDIIIPMFRKSEKAENARLERIESRVNNLWDSHNEKKEESEKLKILSDKFQSHEREFSIFSERYEWHFKETNKKFDEIKELIQHKETSNKQQTDTIYSVLERIEDKLEGK